MVYIAVAEVALTKRFMQDLEQARFIGHRV
jgi:hypothetical protein